MKYYNAGIDSEFITGIIVVLHPVKHQTVDFSICHIKKLHYLCKPKTKGTLAEWLGTGLQNRLRRFESAKYLKRRMSIKSQAFRHPLSFKMMFLKQTFSDVSVVSGLHTCQYACYFSNFAGIINSITC